MHKRNQNNLITDECFMNQQKKENKSIFSYMTNGDMFINNTDCLDTTPGFLNYTPQGTSIQNIDIENDLRGTSRKNSKCATKKWTKSDVSSDMLQSKKRICEEKEKILPKGYYMDPKTMTFVFK
jgi:hypothetical protein